MKKIYNSKIFLILNLVEIKKKSRNFESYILSFLIFNHFHDENPNKYFVFILLKIIIFRRPINQNI